ncbi:hypothetical protein SIIN_5331_T [Serendipita indica DSM 11827]|nr:hypothetical protein SIIN_5331_T [Serendipita indica DSM 11827]
MYDEVLPVDPNTYMLLDNLSMQHEERVSVTRSQCKVHLFGSLVLSDRFIRYTGTPECGAVAASITTVDDICSVAHPTPETDVEAARRIGLVLHLFGLLSAAMSRTLPGQDGHGPILMIVVPLSKRLTVLLSRTGQSRRSFQLTNRTFNLRV